MDTNEHSLSLPRDLDTKLKSTNDRFGEPNAWKPYAGHDNVFFYDVSDNNKVGE